MHAFTLAKRRFEVFRQYPVALARCLTCGLTWAYPPRAEAFSVNNHYRRVSLRSMRDHVCVKEAADE